MCTKLGFYVRSGRNTIGICMCSIQTLYRKPRKSVGLSILGTKGQTVLCEQNKDKKGDK